MGNWQATFLSLKQLPRELTALEIEAFFTFTLAERQLIEDRRRPALKLGLALQIGLLRMCSRLLDAVRIVAGHYIEMWQDLGRQNTLYPQVCNTSRAALRSAATGPSGVESHVAISRAMRASVQTQAGDRASVAV
jgi:hypothetical protein